MGGSSFIDDRKLVGRVVLIGKYPAMIGAMFWTIDADRRGNYNFSNVVGPQLHEYPQTK